MKKIIALILVFVLLFSFTSCSKFKNENDEKFSIIKYAKITGDLKVSSFADEKPYIDIIFETEQQFDTIVLKEHKKSAIESFSIAVKDASGTFRTIYEQFDGIGEYRYCVVGEQKTKTIRIFINSAAENKFEIKEIDVLNVEDNQNKSFRVTSYLVCSSFYGSEEIDATKLKTITDIILFGIARFDESGKVYLQDIGFNGETVSGQETLNWIVSKVQEANPNINVYCNILGPDGTDENDKEARHSQAFIDNGETLANNLTKFVNDNNFDGIFFDYEYPYQKKSKKDYSKFLVLLDSKIGEKKIGVALSGWNCDLSKDAINVIDQVEIMSYDDMGSSIHSPFASYGGALAVETFKKNGYDLSKCDLGLPFYGRTHNGEEAWPSYAQLAGDLNNNPFLNRVYKSYITNEISDTIYTSFNGVQMIMDKTAFANDIGLGGVMIWHYTCDVPYEDELSLFKAIQTSLATRK